MDTPRDPPALRPTAKWRRSAAVYRLFARDPGLDWSEEAAAEMYGYETAGAGPLKARGPLAAGPGGRPNGYAVGKHLADVSAAMWVEDIRSGLLTAGELYEAYPAEHHWFLDRVIPADLRGPAWGLVLAPLFDPARATAGVRQNLLGGGAA